MTSIQRVETVFRAARIAKLALEFLDCKSDELGQMIIAEVAMEADRLLNDIEARIEKNKKALT